MELILCIVIVLIFHFYLEQERAWTKLEIDFLFSKLERKLDRFIEELKLEEVAPDDEENNDENSI